MQLKIWPTGKDQPDTKQQVYKVYRHTLKTNSRTLFVYLHITI
jgi:hypothetical protein